jgi:hypothetical protein
MKKIYIYDLIDLNAILSNNVNEYYYVEEMNLYNLFLNQLKNNYMIVSTIDEADIAFIPIDYPKLIYTSNALITNPDQLPTASNKKALINFFWKNYVEKHIKTTSIPQFMLFSYVLFEIDFSIIPKNIYIVSYETKVTLMDTINTIDNGTANRMIMIPYILNKNDYRKQSKITNYHFNDYTNDDIVKTKQYDIGFFGTINLDILRTINLYNSRKFLLHFNDTSKFNYISGEGCDAEKNLYKIKYLFVLRGDTPTRLCFYQCFAFSICPIIYEKDVETYSQLLLPNINLLNSILIIPDIKDNISQIEYCKTVEGILEKELSDVSNYLNKIKYHKEIFDSLNYFKEPLANPIKNLITRLCA